ncbi:3451_t:CDS:2, partial [Acaulospora colombiana]
VQPGSERAEATVYQVTSHIVTPSSRVVCLAFSGDGTRVVAASQDPRVVVWRVTGEEDRREVLTVSFDGSQVAFVTLDGTLCLLDVRSAETRSIPNILTTNDLHGPTTLQFSPTETILMLFAGGQIRLYHVAKEEEELSGGELLLFANVRAFPDTRHPTFSFDGRYLHVDDRRAIDMAYFHTIPASTLTNVPFHLPPLDSPNPAHVSPLKLDMVMRRISSSVEGHPPVRLPSDIRPSSWTACRNTIALGLHDGQ